MVARRRRRFTTAAIAAAALAAAAALGLRVYLGRSAENRLAPDEIVDFHARGSAGRHNVFAMCPMGFCEPRPDATSPVFAMQWERLRDYWREMIAAQRDVVLVASDNAGRRFTYVQHTPILRFPDIVTVEFIPLGEASSTLAIDSRSRYGRSDLGVNRRRVERWMALLQEMVPAGQEHPG